MIGNRISTLLGERRESIKDLERGAKINYKTCFELYHAKHQQISFDVLNRLCRYFKATPNDLFPYIPDEPKADK